MATVFSGRGSHFGWGTISGWVVASALVVVSLLGAAGCEGIPTPAPPPTFELPRTPTPAPDPVYVVQRGTVQEVTEARGRMVAAQETFLSFEQSGYLKELYIAPGQQVEEGELLAEIELRSYGSNSLEDEMADAEFEIGQSQLELERLEAEPVQQWVDVAEADLERARVAVQAAQARYDKVAWDAANPSTVAAAQSLQQATISYEKAQAAYQARMAQIETHRFEVAKVKQEIAYRRQKLERLKTLRESNRLLAPFDGLVISVDARVGDAVAPYQPIGAMADPSNLALELTIPEDQFDRISPGYVVSVTLDAYPGSSLAGYVATLADKAIKWQGKDAYQVRVAFDEGQTVPATIRMGADALIYGRVREDVLVVPNDVLIVRDGQHHVRLVTGEGVVEVVVVTGIEGEAVTEVVSGLSEGDVIRIPRQRTGN